MFFIHKTTGKNYEKKIDKPYTLGLQNGYNTCERTTHLNVVFVSR